MVGPPGTGKTLLRPGRGRARPRCRSSTLSRLQLRRDVRRRRRLPRAGVRCSTTPASAPRRSSSSTRSTRSAVAAAAAGSAATTSGSRPSTSSWSDMDGFEPGDRRRGDRRDQPGRDARLGAPAPRPGPIDGSRIPLPNQRERAAILGIHCPGASGSHPTSTSSAVSRGTPGFSGADLANLVNEAAIHAVRADRDACCRPPTSTPPATVCCWAAATPSNALLPAEKNAVAIHEAGHALVAVLSPHADPVAKVTILPGGHGARRHRAAARGRTSPLQRGLPDRPARRAAGRPGGRAGRVRARARPGAANDLGRGHPAGDPDGARVRAVPGAGPGRLRHRERRSTSASPAPDGLRRPYSEQTQRIVDEEVSRLLRRGRGAGRWPCSTTTATPWTGWPRCWLEHETIDGSVVLEVLHDKKQLVPRAWPGGGPLRPGGGRYKPG